MIIISKHIDLDPNTKDQLNGFIDHEFGGIPIVQETDWAMPDWTIICYEKDEIATFYNIVERTVQTDNKELRVAGINNVITPKSFRGRGYSSMTMKETESFIFDELKSEAGLLLCADALISFYERLGWYLVDCPVYFYQSDIKKLWSANTMLRTPDEKLNPETIDLNGLPW